MKILVIFTGGTIGSSLQGNYVSLDSSVKQKLIVNYINKFGNGVKFDAFTPYSILSENLSANNLIKMVDCVNENLNKDYDGIIVTHGTDTVQYTAAALAYSVKKSDIPILIVSANYPLETEKTNGNINFEAAVKFIEKKAGKGVFVSYKNTDKNMTHFHYGTRLLTHTETFDDLFSFGDEPYAYYDECNIILNKDFRAVNEFNLIPDVSFCDNPKILVINSCPADSFLYDLSKYKAVIFRPYHSSTINTSNKYLIDFCNKAKEHDVPVFIVNLRSEFIYETSSFFDELGIIKLPPCCFAAIYVKLWIAVSLSVNIKDFMLEPLSGEFIM